MPKFSSFFIALFLLTCFPSEGLRAQLIYPTPYNVNCNGCYIANCYRSEPGRWAWQPRYAPRWYDHFYLEPKCYYQRLDVSKRRHTIADVLGIREGKKLNAVLYGFETGYIYIDTCGLWSQVNFTFTQGKLTGHKTKGRFVHNMEIEGTVGYNIVAYNFTMVPYLGLGYGLYRQRFEEEAFDDHTLKERYHVIYIPFGIRFNYAITPCFEVGLHLGGKPQADSTLKTNLITRNRWELTKTTGYLVELPLTWNVSCFNFYWKIIVTPFWKRTEFGKSSEFRCHRHKIISPQQIYRDWGGLIEAGTLF